MLGIVVGIADFLKHFKDELGLSHNLFALLSYDETTGLALQLLNLGEQAVLDLETCLVELVDGRLQF